MRAPVLQMFPVRVLVLLAASPAALAEDRAATFCAPACDPAYARMSRDELVAAVASGEARAADCLSGRADGSVAETWRQAAAMLGDDDSRFLIAQAWASGTDADRADAGLALMEHLAPGNAQYEAGAGAVRLARGDAAAAVRWMQLAYVHGGRWAGYHLLDLYDGADPALRDPALALTWLEAARLSVTPVHGLAKSMQARRARLVREVDPARVDALLADGRAWHERRVRETPAPAPGRRVAAEGGPCD